MIPAHVPPAFQDSLGRLSRISLSRGRLQATNGKESKNVTVSRQEPDGIFVTNAKAGVMVKLYFAELPKEFRSVSDTNQRRPSHTSQRNKRHPTKPKRHSTKPKKKRHGRSRRLRGTKRKPSPGAEVAADITVAAAAAFT